MSAVQLVSNPTPDVTTYRWSPPGVDKLTRENKLSSLPFWAPNDTTKRHQFRLVLLKGLVPNADEGEDALGLLVELIPPPDGSASAYPQGCIVTASLVPPEVGEHGAAAELVCTKKSMAVLDENHLQISFPELVPSRYVRDERYLSPDTSALTLQIQLQTGANIVAEQVAAPLSSLWGAISSTLASLVKETERVVHDVRVEFAQGTAGHSAGGDAGAVDPEPQTTPWAGVPKTWQGREDAWRSLVRVQLGEDEGTALYGPERPMTLDEKNALVQVGVNPAALVDLQHSFVYDRDVHEGLLESPTLNHMRYLLVPKRMKDDTFWRNYFWKVACLAHCSNEDQSRTVLTILNAPPAEAPKATHHVTTSITAEEIASCVRDAQDSTTLLVEYLADGPSADDALLVDTAAETCRGHIKQLEPLFHRTDLSEAQQQAIGAALRGLRAALKKHNEAMTQTSLPPTSASQGPAVSSHETIPVPTTPPRAPAVSEATSVSTVPVAGEVTEEASPSPVPVLVPETNVAPSTITTTSTPAVGTSPAPLASASASKARSQSRTSQIEFPKMPWEEEEDE